MLFIRNTIIVLLLLSLAAIAVVGIMVEAPPILHYTPERINALGRSVLTVMRPGYLLFATWCLILLGVLLTFVATLKRPRRMKIEVQMGGGKVVIMDGAIKKYIRNALSEIGEITVKRINLAEKRGQVSTEIYADVRTRENLPVLERRVISRVRAALAEDLGITNLGDVHVFIRNFEVTGRPITPAPAPAKKPEVVEDTPTTHIPDHQESSLPAEPALLGGAAIGAATAAALEKEAEAAPLAFPDGAAIAPDEEEEDVVFTDSGLMTTEPAPHDTAHSHSSEEKDLDDADTMPWLKHDSTDHEDKPNP